MIRQVAPRAHERSLALPCVPLHRDVVKGDAARGLPAGPFYFKRRPTPLAAFYFAAGFGGERAAAVWPGIEMFLVPEHGAKRIFLVHVHVVESLRRHIALVFHDGAIGALHIREPRAAGRLYAIRLGIGNLRRGPAKRSSGARPSVATDPYLATHGCRIE